MNTNLYPYLGNGWVIRGTKEIPRLYNIYTNQVIKLNTDILKYILACDGQRKYSEILALFGIKEDVASSFYSQFVNEKVILEQSIPQFKRVDISLGNCEPWLKEVHLDITNNCNLRCKHCFWGENLGYEKNLPYEKWEAFICDLSEIGVGRVVLSGGEALTSEYLLKIIKKCHACNIMVASIFTNGTLDGKRTDEIIRYIVENHLTTTFYISLDGMNSIQHDFIRGTGCFDKTILFIKKLVDIRKQTNSEYKILINSLIHQKNYNCLIEWYEFLLNLGVDGWRFTTGRLSGFMKENAFQIKIENQKSFNEYLKLINYVIDKFNNNEPLLYVNIENFFNLKMLQTKTAYVFDGDLPICDYKTQACSVDPKGNVQFCTGWQSMKFGNVFERNILDIWESEDFRKLKSFKIKDITECRECKYLQYCGGGCRLECKDIYSKDLAICENYEMYENFVVPILQKNGIIFKV